MNLTQRLKRILLSTLGRQNEHVRRCEYAYEMWEALESHYVLQGDIEIANAIARLSAIIMYEAEELPIYVLRLQALNEELDALGKPLTPSEQATSLLNSLNSRDKLLVGSVMLWASTAPSHYTSPRIVSALLRNTVREEINERKRGQPAGGEHHANFGGASAGNKRNLKCLPSKFDNPHHNASQVQYRLASKI